MYLLLQGFPHCLVTASKLFSHSSSPWHVLQSLNPKLAVSEGNYSFKGGQDICYPVPSWVNQRFIQTHILCSSNPFPSQVKTYSFS